MRLLRYYWSLVPFSTHVFANDSPYFLNFSSSSPYIFSSLHGLAQQWPNTFFPNGHTITSCSIPKHTLLYHGRHDLEDPASPEWLAFDIEMAYGIMGNMRDSRMLTYRTSKEVKCIYFDGMSASLMGSGTETQMTFLYGDSDSVPRTPRPGRPGHRPDRRPPGNRHSRPEDEVLPRVPDIDTLKDDRQRWNPLAEEYFRAKGLCEWIKEKKLGGPGWGYEGIVRMNAGFELIWCDFNSSSLTMVSNLNISTPLLKASDEKPGQVAAQASSGQLVLQPSDLSGVDEGPHGPGLTDPNEPFRDVSHYMWFAAAAKRYGSTGMGPGRGEARVKINTRGLFSFYDPMLVGQFAARVEEENARLNVSANGRWKAPFQTAERVAALQDLMRRRRPLRTNHVTKIDGIIMLSAIEERLHEAFNGRGCTGIDWQVVAQEIVAFYSAGLKDLVLLLSAAVHYEKQSWADISLQLRNLRVLTHWLLLPVFEYPPGPHTKQSVDKNFSKNSPAAKLAVERCMEQYMPSVDIELSAGETLLSNATSDILAGICNTITEIGLGVERAWLGSFNTQREGEIDQHIDNSTKRLKKELKDWSELLEELMAWLGWVDQWTGCEGSCKANVCLIQMQKRVGC
jgi:hypothetical protein